MCSWAAPWASILPSVRTRLRKLSCLLNWRRGSVPWSVWGQREGFLSLGALVLCTNNLALSRTWWCLQTKQGVTWWEARLSRLGRDCWLLRTSRCTVASWCDGGFGTWILPLPFVCFSIGGWWSLGPWAWSGETRIILLLCRLASLVLSSNDDRIHRLLLLFMRTLAANSFSAGKLEQMCESHACNMHLMCQLE